MSDARDLCVLTDVRAWLGLSGRPIQSISKAAQAVVGCSNHGAVVGNVVGFSLVGGMVEINNQTGTVVAVGDANTFTVNINSSAFTAYTSGGAVGLDDGIISRLITAVSVWVDTYLGNAFQSNVYNEWRNGTGGIQYFPSHYPIGSIQVLTINGISIPASSGPGVAGYRFTNEVIILEGYTFQRAKQNVNIQYTAGYSTIPADLSQAAISLVALRWRERDRIGIKSKGLAGETVVFNTSDMPDDVQTVLDTYRKRIPN